MQYITEESEHSHIYEGKDWSLEAGLIAPVPATQREGERNSIRAKENAGEDDGTGAKGKSKSSILRIVVLVGLPAAILYVVAQRLSRFKNEYRKSK